MTTYAHTLLTAFFLVNLSYPVIPLILLLQLFLDCASSWDKHKLFIYFLSQSYKV